MRLTDLFSMALRNMLKRKMRTILTVLGVVIGATSITVMISLGVAVNINFEEQIEAMGPRALRINIHQNWQPEPGQITDLNMDVVNRINAMENVRVATPIVDMWSLTVMSGNYIANWVDVVGILPEAMEPLGMHIEQGYGFDLDSD
ncbi:MAG: ABC transporter permease [Defluviitaleaceae bacterium]|nr:ABC transporter permease [Defluviitaleaceae bacterium]